MNTTIATHFREIFEGASLERTIELLTDGELDLARVRFDHWPAFHICCRDVLRQRAALKFAGSRSALAQLMDAILLRFKRNHGLYSPNGWIPVMHLLRVSDGPLLTKPKILA